MHAIIFLLAIIALAALPQAIEVACWLIVEVAKLLGCVIAFAACLFLIVWTL